MSEDELLILQVGEGIIGAEAFAREAIELDHDAAVKGLRRLLDWDISGEYFYALWNDCCEKDTAFAIEVMNDYSKFLIFDALDWLSHIRRNLKNLKEVKKHQDKIESRKKIKIKILQLNVILAFSVFIFAIIDGFVLKGNYAIYNLIIGLIIEGICYLSILNDFNTARIKLIDLEKENRELASLLEIVEHKIDQARMHPEDKRLLKLDFQSTYRQCESLRDLKWQRFAKK